MNVKNVAYELSGPFAKVGALQAPKDSSNLSKNVHKNVFLVVVLNEIYYEVVANYLINLF